MTTETKTPEWVTQLDEYRKNAYKLTDRTSIVADVPVELAVKVPPIEINRDVLLRVNKQRKNFAKGAESALEITVFVVNKPLTVATSFGELNVPAGYKTGDGNTRSFAWMQDLRDPNRAHTVPKSVTVKFVDVNTADEYLLEYDSYDNKDATDTTNNKITGAIRAWGIDMRSAKGMRGQFGESLRYAYPGDSRDSVLDKVKYFEKELPLVDKYTLELESKEMRQMSSTLTSAFLIALKVYNQPATQRQQLLSMMKKVNRMNKNNWQVERHPDNDDYNRLDGAQMIARETILIDQSNVLERGTSRVDYDNSVSFYLYCIEKWMRGSFIHCEKGLKPTFWATQLQDTLSILNERDM